MSATTCKVRDYLKPCVSGAGWTSASQTLRTKKDPTETLEASLTLWQKVAGCCGPLCVEDPPLLPLCVCSELAAATFANKRWNRACCLIGALRSSIRSAGCALSGSLIQDALFINNHSFTQKPRQRRIRNTLIAPAFVWSVWDKTLPSLSLVLTPLCPALVFRHLRAFVLLFCCSAGWFERLFVHSLVK